MKKILAIISNRWVTTILGLLSISVLIWFAGPLIALAGWIPLESQISRLSAIIICLVVWLASYLRSQAKVNKANADLVGEVGGISPGSVEPDDSKAREEIALLKSRFDDALKTLKVSSQKRGGENIYELPWYIIIGPPGSGKTTALQKSGLRFPLKDKFGKAAIHGVGGTRNCDWWFAEEAILLDTAGRYTTQDSDADSDSAAWRGFLKLLDKYRRRRPINGALVTISLYDLLTQSDAERNRHVASIRQRLQELNDELGIRFPVYLILTKCDLLSGFTEFFDDLGTEDRGQVWGCTFSPDISEKTHHPSAEFTREFDLLIDRINRRLLWKLQHERNFDRRKKVFNFPPQFASIKEQLSSFLDDVFGSSRYDDMLMLRGVYFISSTQEGSPIDRVLGSLSRVFNVSPQSIRPFSGEGQAFFVKSLLRDVIFKEAELVGENRRFKSQRRWLHRVAYTFAGGALLAMLFGWWNSFSFNNTYKNRFEEALDDYQYTVRLQDTAGGIESFDQLLQRLNAARAIVDVNGEFEIDKPMWMGFGLYQGDRLQQSALELYRDDLDQYLLPSVVFIVEQDLLASGSDSDLKYEALKTYLMLADEDRREPEQINSWVGLNWRDMYPNRADIQGQFSEHLQSMLELGFETAVIDNRVVASARRDLSQVPLADLLYGRMKRDYVAVDSNPFRLIDATGAGGERVFARTSGYGLAEQGITSLLTYEGYHDYFSEQLNSIASIASAENWILNPSQEELTDPEVEQLQRDLEFRYFRDYIDSWEELLSDLRIVEFQSIRHGYEVLDLTADSNSPLRNLLRDVSRHVSLADCGALETAADAEAGATFRDRLQTLRQILPNTIMGDALPCPEQIVNESFEELITLVSVSEAGDSELDQVLVAVDRVAEQFNAMLMGLGPDAFTLASAPESSEFVNSLQLEASRQPEPVDNWLQQLAVRSRESIFAGARTQINERWQAQVLPMCRQSVNGRYPFARDSQQEIPLQVFGELFGPDGEISRFFAENIQPFVEIEAGDWRWRNFGNTNIGIDNGALTQFQRATTIRDLYFLNDSQMPFVSFRLLPVELDPNVNGFLLEIGDQTFRYRFEPPRFRDAQWPASDGAGRASMNFDDDSGESLSVTENGQWAWFRLLDRQEIEVKSNNEISVTFTASGRRMEWDLHADTVQNPFTMDQLSQFRCPSSLL